MNVLPSRVRNRFAALKLACSYLGAARGEMVLHDRPGGLFSLYCQVLGGLLVSDQLGCSLRLHFVTGDYRTPDCSGTGWWTQFFESDVYNPERKRGGNSVELPATRKSARLAHLGVDMDRHLAFHLSRRLLIRSEILEETDGFERQCFRGHPMLGIHYRGTDKLLIEAVRIPYDHVSGMLSRLDPRIRFFVATDEQAFLDALIRDFGQRIVFREQHRSRDGTPVHHFDADENETGFTRGRDAIIDALLLSRCAAIVRTPSNLSLASTFLNPSIPALVLKPETGSRSRINHGIRKIEQAVISAR
jgi:hypothetical protein